MEQLQKKLSQDIKEIFIDYETELLSIYEKREIIFEYLTQNLTYNFKFLERIRDHEINKTMVPRNPKGELFDVIYTKVGICNSISQYYKFLLEQIGVKAYCVICDDGSEVKHQLTLVYNEETDSYSFDDITSVIVKRGTKDVYFDYDREDAISLNQGNKTIYRNEKYIILPESYINNLVGRNESPTPFIEAMPDNIMSIKKKKNQKLKKLN